MEEVEKWAASVVDHETGTEEEAQAEERVRRVSEDLHCEILDLSTGEKITELCKRKKRINKTVSPRVSAEIPVIGPEDTAEFMNAARQGKLNVIDKYLADGGSPNVHDELKRTALHRASLEGHTAVVQMLLEKGADINFTDQLGSRAVHWACRGGSLVIVKALKSHGADLNVRDKLYSTPLHVATRTGHTAIVEYLLSCGAKINSRDREGDTALHDAVRLNRYRIVKQLIIAGADTKIKNHLVATGPSQEIVLDITNHMINPPVKWRIDVFKLETFKLEGVTAVQQVKQWQFDIMEILQRLEKLREAGLVAPENTSRERSE